MNNPHDLKSPFTLTTGKFPVGKAKEFCLSSDDRLKRDFALSELSFYRGEIRAAEKSFSVIAKTPSASSAAAGKYFMPDCALFSGRPWDFIRIYNDSQNCALRFGKRAQKNIIPAKNAFDNVSDNAFIVRMNIEMNACSKVVIPEENVDKVFVPYDLRQLFFYYYSCYLINTGDAGKAIGIAESSLVFGDGESPIQDILLNLVISRGYAVRHEWAKSERYFKSAWETALPDGFILPFAEYRSLLFGVLERCLRYDYPSEYKKILKLSGKYRKSFVHVHNEITGGKISDLLAPAEQNVASLAASGASNTEIADFLKISVNSVRSHLRNIFNKLNIKSRKELKEYI